MSRPDADVATPIHLWRGAVACGEAADASSRLMQVKPEVPTHRVEAGVRGLDALEAIGEQDADRDADLGVDRTERCGWAQGRRTRSGASARVRRSREDRSYRNGEAVKDVGPLGVEGQRSTVRVAELEPIGSDRVDHCFLQG